MPRTLDCSLCVDLLLQALSPRPLVSRAQRRCCLLIPAPCVLIQVRMLGATRPELRDKMVAFQAEAGSTVAAKGEKLMSEGYEAYLEGMANKSSTVM